MRASSDPNSTIFSELSIAITFFARCAINCEIVPSPAPKSAITIGGISFNSASAIPFQDRLRYVLPPELAGQLVEVAPHVVGALAQRQAQRLLVLRRFRNFTVGLAQQFHQLRRRGQAIEGVLSHAPVFHQAGLLELREVRRNLTLAAREDLLQFGNRQFLLLQQEQHTQPVGIGGQPERFQD